MVASSGALAIQVTMDLVVSDRPPVDLICNAALYTEQTALTAAIENGPLTDEDKKRIAIEEALPGNHIHFPLIWI